MSFFSWDKWSFWPFLRFGQWSHLIPQYKNQQIQGGGWEAGKIKVGRVLVVHADVSCDPLSPPGMIPKCRAKSNPCAPPAKTNKKSQQFQLSLGATCHGLALLLCSFGITYVTWYARSLFYPLVYTSVHISNNTMCN